MNIYFNTRAVFIWMIIICILFLIFNSEFKDPMFYRFGPQPDFKILGLVINNYYRYSLIVIYTFINTYIRTINRDILSPWIIHNLQNTSNDAINKRKCYKYIFFYEINMVSKIYFWFDWFIYMNMLLSQIDMILLESSVDVILSLYITSTYLRVKKTHENNLQNCII